MTLEQALESDFDTYINWCRTYVLVKAESDPITHVLLSYPGAMIGLEASWAKRYWFHKNGVDL